MYFFDVNRQWTLQVITGVDLNKFLLNIYINGFVRCKVLVLGCGSGGVAVAAQLTAKVGKNSVIVVDPADVS